MKVHWINAPSSNALETIEAVGKALANSEEEEPEIVEDEEDKDAKDDAAVTILAENVLYIRQHYAVDPYRVHQSRLPIVGALLGSVQRLARRLTLWQTMPQWMQITYFHAAVVRVVDSLLEIVRRIEYRVSVLEKPRVAARTEVLEKQVEALLNEQKELKRRVDLLESQLIAAQVAQHTHKDEF